MKVSVVKCTNPINKFYIDIQVSGQMTIDNGMFFPYISINQREGELHS